MHILNMYIVLVLVVTICCAILYRGTLGKARVNLIQLGDIVLPENSSFHGTAHLSVNYSCIDATALINQSDIHSFTPLANYSLFHMPNSFTLLQLFLPHKYQAVS